MVELLRAARATVVTGAIVVDHYPKCQACGRTLAEYLGRPWSQKCQRCNAQCKAE